MKNFNEKSKRLQELFGTIAEQVAKQTGFVQRVRKITPFAWLHAVVLGWMIEKKATLEILVEQFSQQNIEISEQGISKRFTAQAAEFFKQMIAQAAKLLVDADQERLPLLERFNGVYVADCTTVRLPNDVIENYPGCGGSGSDEKGAAIKTLCRFELTSGRFDELIFEPGKTSDHKLLQQSKPLPKGALHLLDMGFFDTERLRTEHERGVFWVSRIPANTLVQYEDFRGSVGQFLKKREESPVDLPVTLGATTALPIRLVALRVPGAMARKRCERLRRTCKKKGRPVSEEGLILCQWTVFATNLDKERYSSDEIYTLYRVRWQIELIFK